MSITLSALQQQRRDTAANWTSANPTLLAGEWGYETDTGKWKVGDGSTAWTSLAYVAIPDNNGLIPIDQLLLPLGTAAAPSLTFTGDVDTGIYSPGANQVAISTNGTGRLFVDASGNVKIASEHLRLNTSGKGIIFGAEGGSDRPSIIGNYTSSTNNEIVFNVTGSERLRITSDGKLGLGTSSPSKTLDIAAALGTVGITSNTTSAGNEPTLTLTHAGNNGYVIKGGSNLQFASDNGANTRMTLTTAGLLGVGTTPSYLLHVGSNTVSHIECAVTNSDVGNTGFRLENSRRSWRFWVDDGANGDLRLYDNTASTERLRVDSSGRLGLGTSSPASLLSVDKGNVTNRGQWSDCGIALHNPTNIGAYSQIGFGYTPSQTYASAYIGYLSTNQGASGYGDIVFGTRSVNTDSQPSEAMRIDSSGRVGIGTTAPGELLNLNGVDPSLLVRTSSLNGTAQLKFNADDGNYAGIGLENSALVMRCSNNSTPTERARIDSSGRLLVGTSTARANFYNTTNHAKLQVEGTDNSTSTLSLVQNFNGATLGSRLILGKSNGSDVGSNTIVADGNNIGGVSFQGNDGSEFVEAATILAQVDGTPGTDDMPGRLVFSTTADGASSPTERMRITNNGEQYAYSTGDGITTSVSSAASTTGALFQGRHSASGVTTGTTCFVVRYNGNVQNTNDSYGAISDIKLKENIVDANSQWDDFKAVRFRKYNFKEETGHETFTQLGVVAQELEQVCPGLVDETPDRDEEGNDLGTTTKSVKYSILTKKALVALQEAMERIEQLEQRLTDAGL